MPKFLSQEEFIQRAKAKHGTKYDYSNTIFIATKDNITYICNTCKSKITQRANGHLTGYGCSKCGQEDRIKKISFSFKKFKTIANKLHNNKYLYTKIDESKFNSRTTKLECTDIIVTCKEHGDFTVTAGRHIKIDRLQGCQKCRIDALIKEGRMPGGYCKALFEEATYLAEKPGILYYLKVGNLYKIGITTNLKNRIENIKVVSKQKVEVIFTHETTLGKAFKLEQTILSNNIGIRTVTNWSTELFTKCVIQNITKEIQNVKVP